MQRKLAQLDTEQYWATILTKATDKELADDLTRVVGRIRYETQLANRIKRELSKRVIMASNNGESAESIYRVSQI